MATKRLISYEAMVRNFRRQNYKNLLKQCEAEGKQYVDDEFTPDTSSLFLDVDKRHNLVWKRASVRLSP